MKDRTLKRDQFCLGEIDSFRDIRGLCRHCRMHHGMQIGLINHETLLPDAEMDVIGCRYRWNILAAGDSTCLVQ